MEVHKIMVSLCSLEGPSTLGCLVAVGLREVSDNWVLGPFTSRTHPQAETPLWAPAPVEQTLQCM